MWALLFSRLRPQSDDSASVSNDLPPFVTKPLACGSRGFTLVWRGPRPTGGTCGFRCRCMDRLATCRTWCCPGLEVVGGVLLRVPAAPAPAYDFHPSRRLRWWCWGELVWCVGGVSGKGVGVLCPSFLLGLSWQESWLPMNTCRGVYKEW